MYYFIVDGNLQCILLPCCDALVLCLSFIHWIVPSTTFLRMDNLEPGSNPDIFQKKCQLDLQYWHFCLVILVCCAINQIHEFPCNTDGSDLVSKPRSMENIYVFCLPEQYWAKKTLDNAKNSLENSVEQHTNLC